MRRLFVWLHFLFGHKYYTDLPEGRMECQDCGIVVYRKDFPPESVWDETLR